LSAQFASNGNIVTAGRDNRARIWKGDGTKIRDLEPGKDLFTRSSFNHDGTVAYASDWLGNLHAYNAADGTRRDTLATNPPSIATRITTANEIIKEHETKLAAAQKAKTDSEAVKKRLSDEIAALEGQITNTKSTLQSATAEVSQLTSTQQRLSGDRKKTEQSKAQKQSQLDTASQTLKSTSEKLQAAKATHGSLQPQIEAKRKELESAQEADRPAFQAQLDALNQQATDAQTQIKGHGETVAAATTTRDQTTEERDAITAKITQIDQEHTRTDEALKSATATVQNSKTAIPNLEKQLAEKRNAVAPTDARIAATSAQLKTATETLASARSRLDHWNKAQAFMEKRRLEANKTAAR
ncbi:MAG: hypothetical protein P8J87_21635, partial [Verrucomicrobiales bacterium]|nr:hypothetical protein [Verrucomicrobiales bacterium]